MFFNISEPQEEEAKDREQKDCQTVTSLCRELGIESVGIQKSYRVGKAQPGKHRPLKITLDQRHTKYSILKNAKKLKHSQTFKGVGISLDQTPKEREQEKTLRLELSRRRDQGERDLKIVNRKIVQGGRGLGIPRQPNPS